MTKTVPKTPGLLLAGALALTSFAPAGSCFKDGCIHLLQSSHHDLGWHKGSYEAEGKSGTVATIKTSAKLSGARRTNLIEEDAGDLEHSSNHVTIEVPAFSIETLKLTPGS